MPALNLDAVASDILGATGRAIIQAIIKGKDHPDWLADYSKGKLQGKLPDLVWLCVGASRSITDLCYAN